MTCFIRLQLTNIVVKQDKEIQNTETNPELYRIEFKRDTKS